MPTELPAACRELADRQRGVLSRQQALRGGMDASMIGRLVRSGRWQPLQRGVYATYSGEPPRESLLWAALHRAGPGAVLSHHSAAELDRLTDKPSPVIHVTIPVSRTVSCPGVMIHRSRRVDNARHPALLPPRTRIEETVLDLVHQASTFDAVFHWASAAC